MWIILWNNWGLSRRIQSWQVIGAQIFSIEVNNPWFSLEMTWKAESQWMALYGCQKRITASSIRICTDTSSDHSFQCYGYSISRPMTHHAWFSCWKCPSFHIFDHTAVSLSNQALIKDFWKGGHTAQGGTWPMCLSLDPTVTMPFPKSRGVQFGWRISWFALDYEYQSLQYDCLTGYAGQLQSHWLTRLYIYSLRSLSHLPGENIPSVQPVRRFWGKHSTIYTVSHRNEYTLC